MSGTMSLQDVTAVGISGSPLRAYLQAKHPENHNVKAKVRQQLQFLRDKGVVRFLFGEGGIGRWCRDTVPVSYGFWVGYVIGRVFWAGEPRPYIYNDL